jgi:hypothetical protein
LAGSRKILLHVIRVRIVHVWLTLVKYVGDL